MKATEVGAVFETVAPFHLGLQSEQQKRGLGFQFGDPDVEVTGVGVAWFASMEVVRAAAERGINMLLVHEPHVFHSNANTNWHTPVTADTNPANLAKMKILIDNRICVYVAHSNWDLQPEVGMQPTVARAFGFSDEIKRDKALGVYRVGPIRFDQLIAKVKNATGLDHLRVQGDNEQIIETVALGFGFFGFAVDAILANGADAGIFGELNEHSFIAAREMGFPVIEASHLVSESIGFRSALESLRERLPELRLEFLDPTQDCL